MADYFVMCEVCGQQVANGTKICPFCGSHREMALWLKMPIIIPIVIFVFIMVWHY